jgi:GAF domain-containing protein
MQGVLETFIRVFLTPQHRYADRYDILRARLTMFLCLLDVITNAFLIIAVLVSPVDGLQRVITVNLISLLIGVAGYLLASTGRLALAGLIVLIPLAVGAIEAQALGEVLLTIPILYAALMYGWVGVTIVTVIEIVALVTTTLNSIQVGNAEPLAGYFALVNSVVLVIVAVFLAAVVQALVNISRLGTRLLTQLRATAEIAQTTVSAQTQDELLSRIANYIRDRFGFYQVQIFLTTSDHRFATLVASTNERGQAMQQRGYRVAIGAPSVVGQVSLLGEAVNVTRADNQAAPLSETDQSIRSEVGLPLVAEDQILGVLDVQSTLPKAFSAEDVESLRIVAAQVSLGIRNSQVFEEQKTALNENRRLFLEAEVNLREMQRLNQRLTGEAWEDYLKAQRVGAIGYTVINNQLRADTAWTDPLAQAAGSRRPVILTNNGRQVIAVPVELRGKAIGAIEVETDTLLRQTETLEMLQSVAQRLALSIDNARLFEQAQELAQQELEVNTISARLQGVNTMEEIVKMTVDELSRALGADHASIRLGAIAKNGSKSA